RYSMACPSISRERPASGEILRRVCILVPRAFDMVSARLSPSAEALIGLQILYLTLQRRNRVTADTNEEVEGFFGNGDSTDLEGRGIGPGCAPYFQHGGPRGRRGSAVAGNPCEFEVTKETA